jgi:hypothetical protein
VGHAAEHTEWQAVLHFVHNPSSASLTEKAVLVVPEFVRSFELQIDEAVWRVPFDNFGRPTNGEDSPAQRVADQGSFFYRLRVDAEDTKMQPGRGELLKILGAGEEIENFVERPPDELLRAESVRLGGHEITVASARVDRTAGLHEWAWTERYPAN